MQLSRWQLHWFIDVPLTSQLNFLPCEEKKIFGLRNDLAVCVNVAHSCFHLVLFSRNLESASCLHLKAILFHSLQLVMTMLGTKNFWSANYVLRALLGTSPSLGKNSNKRLCWETRERASKTVLGYAMFRGEDQGLNHVFTNLHFVRKWIRKTLYWCWVYGNVLLIQLKCFSEISAL